MPEQSTRRQYPTHPASVPLARAQVRELLGAWGVTDASEDAAAAILVASELASNAVVHGDEGRPFSVSVELYGDVVCVSVRDSARQAPVKQAAQDDDTNGRGLFLVSNYARDWGWRTEVVGKTVWAEINVKVPTCSL
ncbi:ATP-binding protein [Streptomyces chartreusis]|uniref:ATP-binding protein n=1 Tax=Streptomyces chartreusis TaxID=1969 RepID=UPI0033FFC61E